MTEDHRTTTGRGALEQWLAAAPFNAYFRFRVGAIGEGTCTLEVPFHEEFLRPAGREPFRCTGRLLKVGRHLIYAVAECLRSDGTLLSHHTVMYARAGERAAPRHA